MSELFASVLYTLSVIFLTIFLTFDSIYKSGQVSVASGLQLCEIVGDVRQDKTIKTEWVCKPTKEKGDE